MTWANAASLAFHATPAELRDACVPAPPRYPLVDAILALLESQPDTQLQQQLQVALTPQRLSRRLAEHVPILSTRRIQVKFRRTYGGARRIELSRTAGEDKPATSAGEVTDIGTASYAGGDDHPQAYRHPLRLHLAETLR